MSDKAKQIRALQDQVKADGFQRLPDEKAFMDELSGEDAGRSANIGQLFSIFCKSIGQV